MGMGNFDKLRPWRHGDNVKSTSHLSEPASALNALLPLIGAGGVSVEATGAGTIIRIGEEIASVIRVRLGVIVNKGPNGEADFTDERYWIATGLVAPHGGSTVGEQDRLDLYQLVPPTTGAGSSEAVGEISPFPATNLAERDAHTHTLATDATLGVIAIEVMDIGESPQPRCLFVAPPPGCVIVKIAATASGGGKYTGPILINNSTATATGNLALPEGMTESTVHNAALILNTEENGLPTHWLKVGAYCVGRIAGRLASGQNIVEVCGGAYRTASPQALAGSGATAATDSWDRTRVTAGTAYGDCPLTEAYVTRVYFDTANDIIYQFTRTKTYDAGGRLVSISAETRSTITATELGCV